MSVGAVSSNIYALDYAKYQAAQTQLSSGKRINSAADDPAGYAIATALESQAAGYAAASQNIANAQNALNVAAGGLASNNAGVSQLNTLAIAGANDFLSATDRAALQAVGNQLTQQVNAVAQTTSFNGQQLLNGTFAGAIQSGANEGNVTQVAIGSASAAGIGLNPPNFSSTANAQATEVNATAAQQNLLSAQATLGAQQVTLGYEQNAAQVATNAYTASASSITDLNVGQAVTQASQSQLQYAIALYTLHQSNLLAATTGNYVNVAA